MEIVNLTMITKQDVVFISGPMTGHRYWNYPAFHAMESFLIRKFHCKVINPARNFGARHDLPWKTFLRKSIGDMAKRATKMIMLNGWEKSRGAKLEKAVAKAFDIPVFYERDL